MSAGHYDILIEQGATFTRTITWYPDDDADSDPVDVTGYSARLQAKQFPVEDGDAAVIELTSAGGEITLGGTAGTVTLALTATETAALIPTRGLVYDLELESAGGTVTRLLEGMLSVSQEVTV